MRFSFEAKTVLELEHEHGAKTSKHIETKVNLYPSKNMDKSMYLDKYDLPTAYGSKVLTNVLVQGLIANIHSANNNGFWKDHEHMKYIISELERGFVTIAETDTSTF